LRRFAMPSKNLPLFATSRASQPACSNY
jgi:hypothetical protein